MVRYERFEGTVSQRITLYVAVPLNIGATDIRGAPVETEYCEACARFLRTLVGALPAGPCTRVFSEALHFSQFDSRHSEKRLVTHSVLGGQCFSGAGDTRKPSS